jgi:hypothetical protein
VTDPPPGYDSGQMMLVSTAKGGRVAVGWVPGNGSNWRDEDMVVGGIGWVRRQVSKAVAYSRTRGSQLVSFPSHSSYAITSPHEELLNKMRTESGAVIRSTWIPVR